MRKLRNTIAFLLGLTILALHGISFAAGESFFSVQDICKQAKPGWHQSYSTARGETVTTDVDIAVPAVTSFPCYYAKRMQPVDGVPTSKRELAEFGEAETVNGPGSFRYDWPNHFLRRQWKHDAEKNGTFLDALGEPRALLLRFGNFDMDTAYSVNNPPPCAMRRC